MLGQHDLRARAPELACATLVARELRHRARESKRVCDGHDDSASMVPDELRLTRQIANDHGRAAGERFEHLQRHDAVPGPSSWVGDRHQRGKRASNERRQLGLRSAPEVFRGRRELLERRT